MDDFIESMWAQFGIETEDHIDSIERMLLAAETGQGAQDDISAIFRAFHSLKGLAKAMDLLAMEGIAHRSEDILGLVRSGVAKLDHPTSKLLLEAVDALKELHRKAEADRSDGVSPPGLTDRLQAHFKKLSGEDTQAPEPEAENFALTDNDEELEMLGYFAEHIQSEMPSLVASFNTLYATEKSEDAHNVALQQVLGTIEGISFAAEAVGVVAIVSVLNELSARLAEETLNEDAIRRLLREFLDLVLYLEDVLSCEAGSKELVTFIESAPQNEHDALFQLVLDELNNLSINTGNISALLVDLNRLSADIKQQFVDLPCDILPLLRDVLTRVKEGEFSLEKDTIACIQNAISSLHAICIALTRDKASASMDAFLQEQKAFIKQIRDLVWMARTSEGGEAAEGARQFAEALGISAELSIILTPENVTELKLSQQAGEHLYEILVHLEQSPESASEFLSYIQERARLITNRSVFFGEESWYELLVASSLSPKLMENELCGMESYQKHLLKAIQIPTTAEGDQCNIDRRHTKLQGIATSGENTDNERLFNTPAQDAAASSAINMIRVPGEALDRFMAQIGDMVLVHSQLRHAMDNDRARDALLQLKRLVAARDKESDILFKLLEALEEQQQQFIEAEATLHGTLNRLREGAMSLRVVPMEIVFKRLPRVVRDLAQFQGKSVRLELSGEEVRVDKTMFEVLSDPLLHMVRNAVDHGIERPEERLAQGKPAEAYIRIRAVQQGGRVLVQISDDGRGIDPQKVLKKALERGLVAEDVSHSLSKEDIYQFLFQPGFSTADEITETSGRGVGMDVVRSNVVRLGGVIQVRSEVGHGSVFSLSLPLSAAVLGVLMVGLGSQTFGLPQRYVAEVIEIEDEQLHFIKARPAILLRGSFLPMVHLRELLGMGGGEIRNCHVVIISNEHHRLAIAVDRIFGSQDLFVKDLHAQLAALPGVGGAALLGDGRVVLILDGEDLFRLAEKTGSLPLALVDAIHKKVA